MVCGDGFTKGTADPPRLKPPTGAGGFGFGASVDETRFACENAHFGWGQNSDDEFVCAGTADDIGVTAQSTLTFCGGKLCVIELATHPESNWPEEISSLIDTLTERYGPVEKAESGEGRTATIPGECREILDQCFADGRAHSEAFWSFRTGERIKVFAGKPEGGEPALIVKYEKRRHNTKKRAFHAL